MGIASLNFSIILFANILWRERSFLNFCRCGTPMSRIFRFVQSVAINTITTAARQRGNFSCLPHFFPALFVSDLRFVYVSWREFFHRQFLFCWFGNVTGLRHLLLNVLCLPIAKSSDLIKVELFCHFQARHNGVALCRVDETIWWFVLWLLTTRYMLCIFIINITISICDWPLIILLFFFFLFWICLFLLFTLLVSSQNV